MAFLKVGFLFISQGYRCPSNYNPSDYYIKVLAISPGEKEKCEETVKVHTLLFIFSCKCDFFSAFCK